MQNFTFVKEVLRNNQQSHNLISPCYILVVAPRDSTSFTRPFLTRRFTWAGNKTSAGLATKVTHLR